MTTLPPKTSTFTSTDQLNQLLSATLSQTKSDLAHLTSLTKKKLGKRAIMLQERTMYLSDEDDEDAPNSSRRNTTNVSRSRTKLTGQHSGALPTKPRLKATASGRMSQKPPRVTSSQGLDEETLSTVSTPSMDDSPRMERSAKQMGSRRHLEYGSKRGLGASASNGSLHDIASHSGEMSDNHSPIEGADFEHDGDLYVLSNMRRGATKRRHENTTGNDHSESHRLPDFVVPPVNESAHAPKVQRDYDLLNQLIETLKEKEKQRKKRGYTKAQFTEVYERIKQLLEELWEEMHVPSEERASFGRLAFNTKTTRNCVIIFDEISRLCKIRSLQHNVITKIEQREVFIKRLQTLDLRARNGTNPDILSEVSSVVLSLRTTSVELIELILEWRASQKNPRVFSWNDENYLRKMFSDLNWLHMSSFSSHFPFSVENNSFLLPHNMRCELARKRIHAENPPPKKGAHGSTFLGATPKTPRPTPFSPSSFLSPTGVPSVVGDRNRSTSEAITDLTINVLSSEEPKLQKPLSNIMRTLEQTSKEELERIQAAEQIIEAEEEYMNRVKYHILRNRAASRIQTVVRAMLARKEAHLRRKAQRIQERHRSRVLARMEEEQALRKEETRLQKKNSISQLISQLDEDSLFAVPQDVAKKLIGNDEPTFDPQESLFDREDVLWSDPSHKKNGRHRVKLNLVQ